jgi:hypothetical protein
MSLCVLSFGDMDDNIQNLVLPTVEPFRILGMPFSETNRSSLPHLPQSAFDSFM